MTRGDTLVEHGADRLADLAQTAEKSGGVKAKLAPELAGDAEFLRKMKPSLILERARGTRGIEPSPANRPKQKRRGGGPNPFVIAAAAFAVGMVAAKLVDWRGHAHPRV